MECRADKGADEISNDGVAVGVGNATETGTEGRQHTDRTPTPQEGELSVESDADPLPTLTAGAEEEGVIHASRHVAGEEPPRADSPGGMVATGGGGEAAANKKDVPTAVGSEQAEDTDTMPASSVAVAAESDGTGAAGGEERGNGGGGESDSSDNSGNGDGALNREVDGDVNSREAAAGEATGGCGVEDKSGPVAAHEPETIDEDGIAEGVLNGDVVAEDFFAEGDSSGEDDFHPEAVAATGIRIAPTEDVTGNSDQGQEHPARDHPPSPRIIASSLQTGGFGYPPRSPVLTQGKESPATVGEGGLSEAAKAAVAAALASASSAPSSREGEGSKSRKKKNSHKEKRRKRSGSKSGGEEDAVAGDRGSGGSAGRREDGTGREKRSSSRRRHRKPTA